MIQDHSYHSAWMEPTNLCSESEWILQFVWVTMHDLSDLELLIFFRIILKESALQSVLLWLLIYKPVLFTMCVVPKGAYRNRDF